MKFDPAPRAPAAETASGGTQGDEAALRARFIALQRWLEEGLIGHAPLVSRLLIGLLTGGHLLVEGPPGVAKTRAVKRLTAGVAASFARIQCTPDLMPADLTGTPVFRPDRGLFEFVEGPVFHSLLLVDEVNRAPPKVQSALLEAMGEHQVTAGGETYRLPDPFMVVATQNPIEHEGTFPLPEAQLDRFLLHVLVGLPDEAAERRIIDLVEGEGFDAGAAVDPPPAVLDVDTLRAGRAAAMTVHAAPALKDYIVRLVCATRPGGGENGAGADVARLIEHAVSPRGALALTAAAKARAWLDGRDHVEPQDVADLAGDALAHRVVLTWRAAADGETPRGVIARLVDAIPPL